MAVLADSELAVEAKRRKITPAVAAEKAASVKALASIESKQTMWTRTEQRRVEREAWEKKQREREEEVRRLKEQQRMKEAVSCVAHPGVEPCTDFISPCRSKRGSSSRR